MSSQLHSARNVVIDCGARGSSVRRSRAGRARRPEPEARDDAEVAAAAAGERPPELVIRIRRIARRDDAAGAPVRVDRDDLDGVKVVRRQPELPAQKPERPAGDVPAHADAGILAQRHDHAPPLGQRPERLPHRRARLDDDRAPLRIERDPLHRRDVDDDLDLRIRNEPFQAMPAARHDDAPVLADRVADRRDDIFRRTGEADVVGRGDEALVEAFVDDGAVARRRRARCGQVRRDVGIGGRLPDGSPPANGRESGL